MSQLARTFFILALLCTGSGCSSLLFKIKGTPATQLSDQYRPVTRNNRIPIDYRLLGQVPPPAHLVDSGDVLGILIDGIFPFSPPDAAPPIPPVNFSSGSLKPSTGFPTSVQENGAIHLPSLAPLMVRGLTLDGVRDKIIDAYSKAKVAAKDDLFPIVTLIKPRTVNVSVIRQDFGSSANNALQLEIYRNDILNALLMTGGMPGPNSKDRVTVLRRNAPSRPLGQDRSNGSEARDFTAANPQTAALNAVEPWMGAELQEPFTIPLTQYQGECFALPFAEAVLYEGDIVYIESRESEVYYTSGMLPGGQFLLPRDYDIDIFEAMSIAGFSYGQAGSAGGGGLMGITGVAPTQLFIFRKDDNGCQITIEVDLEKAICNPRERLVVKAGDKLFLRYNRREEIANFGIFAIFTFGFQQLFSR